ncbi:Crp/Fnr family transcriptional regulator [Mucilaginibacter auburnensis]|uniref:CRP-like cAMP-binding protein n=1 Tax=Mucilaginibacter auburnensis TaxID=1457233 RepID=A0A2H9VRG2_9SPHI|nr:Crp/Fnr family transcriptional regulator [Mucilaginibacter auburnensis]PJJ83391.1 CRP-like cAMP-binding protein [Mucilaginibacter auburnensis]
MDALIAHIKKFIVLSSDEEHEIQKHFKIITLKKKAWLLTEGQICKSNYFVEKGCLRMYYITEKGTEQITQFALENWWLADHMSLMMQKPSPFFIQAVEDTHVATLDFAKQEELLQQVPKMERYFRLMMQRGFAAMQMRVKYLHDFSKEEAYMQFSASFPDFVQRVPQYMLASYLGLTPEYLSEIRKKKH